MWRTAINPKAGSIRLALAEEPAEEPQLFYRGKKALVAGATGLIGANLVEALLATGAEIRATLHEAPAVIRNDRIEYMQADLRTSEDCRRVVRGIDFVFVCAADTSGAAVMVHNPMAQITGNVLMNTLLMEAAVLEKVERLLFISSSAVYPPADYPVREGEGFDGDPYETYFGVAWMKRYAEKLATFYHRRYGLETAIVRPSNVYGPYDKFDPERSHVLPALIRRVVAGENPLEVWGAGDEVRDFIYVDDFVQGLLLAMEKCADAQPVNIGSGRLTTIAECAEIIVRQSGLQGVKLEFDPSKPTTIPYRAIEVRSGQQRLGFAPRISLEDGLRRTIDWYRCSANRNREAKGSR